jgi:predicted dehydrogenase
MEPTNFAIIGAGAISQAYAQAFQAYTFKTCHEAEVVGVADVRKEAAESLAEVLNCPAFDSHTALYETCAPDAVIICTPPASHPEICHFFIDRGVHVLCEKPFAIDVKQAVGVVEAAKAKGVTITMASKFRYVDDVIKAKQIVDSGILGDIVLFENAFTARVGMATRWNSDRAISGGGVLIDNGTHSFDIARYFLGPLADVQVMEGKRNQGLDVEETVRIFVRSAKGVIGNIDLSWSINKELDRYISIYGSRGTVVVGWKEARYCQSSSSEWVTFGNGYDKVAAFRNQLQNFTNAIRGEEQLLINGTDAIASVEVVEAAYESLGENHWTAVNNGAPALV